MSPIVEKILAVTGAIACGAAAVFLFKGQSELQSLLIGAATALLGWQIPRGEERELRKSIMAPPPPSDPKAGA